MKKYQVKRNLRGETLAATDLAVLPEFASGDPVVDATVYRFFDRNGDYLGWCDADTGRKFFYGKLYYKTKGAYRIKTRLGNEVYGTRVKKIFVYEKNTNALAAYAVLRKIGNSDLIDLNDREMLCKMTMESILEAQFDRWNFTSFPNPYNIIPKEMRNKLENDLTVFLESKKAELVQYCQEQLNAFQAQRTNTHIHEINLANF